LRLTTLPPVSRLNSKCGSLDVSQPYGLPWPIGMYLFLPYLGRVFSPSQDLYLTEKNKYEQTSTHRVEFEPMIPAFQGTKTVHALDRKAKENSIQNINAWISNK
jgi:hypothetical protein